MHLDTVKVVVNGLSCVEQNESIVFCDGRVCVGGGGASGCTKGGGRCHCYSDTAGCTCRNVIRNDIP